MIIVCVQNDPSYPFLCPDSRMTHCAPHSSRFNDERYHSPLISKILIVDLQNFLFKNVENATFNQKSIKNIAK